MAFVLRLGAVDVSNYVQVGSDTFDPCDSDWLEPSFMDSPFGDGQPLAALDVKNRELVWPLLLRGAGGTKDQMHVLVQQINNEIARPTSKPLRVEWRDSGATDSTFYDVAYARLEPDFRYRRSEKGWGQFVLRVWAAGYGHTGTDRLAATAAGTQAARTVTLPSIGGDAPAITEVRLATGSMVRGQRGRILGVAALPHPSYIFDWAAASITRIAADASLVGATQAQASQALAVLSASPLPSAPLASYRSAIQIVLSPASIYAGQRHRLLMVNQANTLRGVALNHAHAGGIGPTAVASLSHNGYQLTDLGVISMPSNPAASYPITIQAGGGPIPTGRLQPDLALASHPYALYVNRLLLVPEDSTQFVVDMAAIPIAGDSFVGTGLINDTVIDQFGNPYASNGAPLLSSPTHGGVASTAAPAMTTRSAWALIAPRRDVAAQGVFRLQPSAAVVLGAGNEIVAQVELNKPDGNTVFKGLVRLASGVCSLSEPGGASVAIPSVRHNALLVEAGKVGTSAWVSARGLNTGLPVFASIAALAQADIESTVHGLTVRAAATMTSGPSTQIAVDSFSAVSVPSETHAARGVYWMGESIERADASGYLLAGIDGRARGGAVRAEPSLPALGIFQLAYGERANDVESVEIRVRERFVYAR